MNSKLLYTTFLAGVLSAGSVAAQQITAHTKHAVHTATQPLPPELQGKLDTSVIVEKSNFKAHTMPLNPGEDIWMMSEFAHGGKKYLIIQPGTYEPQYHKTRKKYTYNEVVMIGYDTLEELTEEFPTSSHEVYYLAE